MVKDPIIVTDNAAARVKDMLMQRSKPAVGIRISVETKGCSGKKYKLEYADEISKFDAVIKHKDVCVLIDPKAMLYIVGTTMDYVEEELSSGFIFQNPNEKGKCGCGESFHA